MSEQDAARVEEDVRVLRLYFGLHPDSNGDGRIAPSILAVLDRVLARASDPAPDRVAEGADQSFARAVAAEVARARSKFPGNRHQYVALAEEVGEVAKALIEGESPEAIYAECVQVAAMAQRVAEDGDDDFPAPPRTDSGCNPCWCVGMDLDALPDAPHHPRCPLAAPSDRESRVEATVQLILETLDNWKPDSGLGTARQYVEHTLGTMGALHRFEELLEHAPPQADSARVGTTDEYARGFNAGIAYRQDLEPAPPQAEGEGARCPGCGGVNAPNGVCLNPFHEPASGVRGGRGGAG